ncbi:MAG TPA: glycosyltransferase, partial [Tepidisphaeraceae bacterium]|nr:glycosyltransferase [Tepidisphaeraceae bacterium]
VEAQACGTPVIAFGRGGARESIIDGRTGLFFSDQTVEAVIDAVERFESRDWDYAEIRRNAERFSVSRFRDRLIDRVRSEWAAFKAGQISRQLGVASEHPDRPALSMDELEAAEESMEPN